MKQVDWIAEVSTGVGSVNRNLINMFAAWKLKSNNIKMLKKTTYSLFTLTRFSFPPVMGGGGVGTSPCLLRRRRAAP